MKKKRLDEIKGIILFSLGVLVLASLISYTPNDLSFYTSSPNVPAKNLVRIFGAYLSGLLFFLIGWSSYFLVVLIFLWAKEQFSGKLEKFSIFKIFGLVVFFLSLSSLLALFGGLDAGLIFKRAGFVGWRFCDYLLRFFGRVGSSVVLITLILLSLSLAIEEFLPSSLFLRLRQIYDRFYNLAISKLFRFRKKKAEKEELEEPRLVIKPRPIIPKEEFKEPPKIIVSTPSVKIKTEKPLSPAKPRPQEVKIGDYQLPSLDLLESPPPLAARQIKDDLTTNARILKETLSDFGISVKVSNIERGPVITRYEVEPAPGVKIHKIVSLSDDISLAMKAQSVRIVAPIPGKGLVGVEVPNTQSSLVYLKEVLSTDEFVKSNSKLALALGKDITGKPVVTDLCDMPHLLIAGTTGSGKTVCVNSLVMSILYKATPSEVKFIMVDPKMVELAPFNGLPHLICPVVTDAKKVSAALNWVVNEMEERYTLLAKESVRNIDAYNERHEKLPYIMVIVDELADLMVVAANQIENAITRLAQLSRAVGIHLVLATQRPSVDVITGVIKANFPARISFKVASKVDSRTVLDMNGADKLLGKGDMLFLKPGQSKPIRAQGSLLKDKEIENVVNFIKAQGEPVFNEDILKEQTKSLSFGDFEKDELFDEAVRLILESNQASVSILQRRMRLGYTRAARLIDMMEQESIVGPYQGSKPRKILVDRKAWLIEHGFKILGEQVDEEVEEEEEAAEG
ncbi:MAG: DNA translocase FtsK [Candidatus Omnitrophota bacterium]